MAALRKAEHIKNTHKNHAQFISAICAILLHERRDVAHPKWEEWRELQRTNSQPERERKLEGKPTPLQEGKAIEWSEVCKVRDELELGTTKVLLGLYTHVPPMRGGDFYDCLVFYDSDMSTLTNWTTTGNYILLTEKDPKIVFTDYKTKTRYGTIEIPIPPELYTLLDAYLSNLGYPLVLFLDNDGFGFKRESFSNWANRKLAKAFGRPITITVLRHAYIRQLDFNKPIKELNEIAKSMAHSVETQRMYAWDSTVNEVVMPEKK